MAKTYESYKDSGSTWIGRIPSGWELGNFRYYGEFTKGKLPSSTNVEAKGLPIIGASEMLGKECRTFTEETNVPHCKPDDILILWDGANAGIISSHHTGVVSSTAVKYSCLNPDVNKNYLFYLLKSVEPFFKEEVNGTTIPHMNMKYINEVPLLIPSSKEQQSIASFLDTKCGEIDSLISLQEEMISELQAYKQSVITEAVTKGLDPNAKMNCCASREKNDACISSSETQPAIERKFKDSGVEWIGEIPEGWEVLALKRIFKIIAGATPKSENEAYWDGDIAWITPADYKTEQKYVSFGRRNLSEQGYHACSTVLLPKGSIVFSKRAPIGLVAITERELCTNQGCLGCVPIRDVSNVFMYYLLSVYTEQFELYGSGTTFKEISANNFANFKLMLPPLSEQQAIASYLDVKTSQIDSLISLKQQKIDELKSYKKSIIYEYVTGKKRV